MRADWETVRVAEAYRQHELLRHMPVPRFRLPEVSIDLPVLIDSLQGETSAGLRPLFDAPSRAELTAATRRVLAQSAIRPSVKQRQRLYSLISRRATAIFKEAPNALVGSQRFSRELTELTLKELKGADADATKLAATSTLLKAAFSNVLVRRLLEAPQLEVAVATSAVRENGTETLTRVNLRVSEDSMELAFDDHDDPTSARLVPE
jgi:hypothetical protein